MDKNPSINLAINGQADDFVESLAPFLALKFERILNEGVNEAKAVELVLSLIDQIVDGIKSDLVDYVNEVAK